ncbi:SycD/LcrH family type III secretion system chaperone [Achromobacter xylosoxidans]|uniref:SycD/LcrH family type III secretion system chaperone n=1 Tax=Alcaligenes xylosoxydans xylosoxydans TaxID=85698 RepID=UPI003D286D0D
MTNSATIGRSPLGQQVYDGLANLPSARRFTPEQLEVIYALGYAHVAQGQYAQALPIFAFLSQYGPTRRHYLYGLALCLQMAGRYDEALNINALCATLFPESALPTLRIAECQMAAGQTEEARATLTLLTRYARAGGEADVGNRAQALLDLMAQ